MTKIVPTIPDTKEGIRLLPEVVRNMFQEDMDDKDEGGVYEIKYGDHMFFIPKRMDDGVEAMMAIDKICCRGFSFKRKRKKLISFMRDIWAFAIDEDRHEVTSKISEAICDSEALKILLPIMPENFSLVGVENKPLSLLIKDTIKVIKKEFNIK